MNQEFREDDINLALTSFKRMKIISSLSCVENVLFDDGNAFAGYQREVFSRIEPDENVTDGTRRIWCTVSCLPKDIRRDADLARETVRKAINDACKDSAAVTIAVVMPEPTVLPDGVTALAEREYDYYLMNKEEHTPAETAYLEIERICRKTQQEIGVNVILVRLQNIFGPGIDMVDGFEFERLGKEMESTGCVSSSDADAQHVTSVLYAADALAGLALTGVRGKSGHIYNGAGKQVSWHDLKVAAWRARQDVVSLSSRISGGLKCTYHSLMGLKMQALVLSCIKKWSRMKIGESVYRTIMAELQDGSYDMQRMLTIYDGHLGIIREQEMRTLKEVDAICERHGIRYFLAGGSLLGAVRHHAMIPWDDDLDIGMLREDFEKFRKIAPVELPGSHVYESPYDGKGSHYQFDKIRLCDTYFSTRYSSHFVINDGIFLDIIVYDRTSKWEFLSKLHIRAISFLSFLVYNHWWDRPIRARHRRFLKITMPFLRLLPTVFFNHLFEFVLRIYEKRTRSPYLIDGLGQNIAKGRFPRAWLEEIERVDFGDFKAPIPKGYDGYLSHFYGPKYMEWLPISKRVSGHHLARIDLGANAFCDGPVGRTRKVDIRGELFEQE